MHAHDIQNQLEREIPITKELGFRLTDVSLEQALGLLPIVPNRNHKSTLFGGSQYSGCALICYSLFLFGVRSTGSFTNNIVVSDATINYLRPVESDGILKAQWEDEEARRSFFDHLERKGKARVSLKAHVLNSQGLILSEFRGNFVVFK